MGSSFPLLLLLPLFPSAPLLHCSPSSTSPSSSTPSPPSNASIQYIGADELCVRETRIRYCNMHSIARLCVCYVPQELLHPDLLLCSRVLRLDSLEYLVLTISVAFPLPHSFQFDLDSIFAEDLELFTGNSRHSVFILRKGCAAQKDAYQFQFAILRPDRLNKRGELSEADLRLIHPKMFTDNANFMRQKGLLVARVEQTKFLRPLVGFADWIHRDEFAHRGFGICHRPSARNCYWAEMCLLFVLGVYVGAQAVAALLWRAFVLRHGVAARLLLESGNSGEAHWREQERNE